MSNYYAADREYKLTVENGIKMLEDFISHCDKDELSDAIGYLFGGKCRHAISDDLLHFEPDEYYGGVFEVGMKTSTKPFRS